MRTMKWRTLLVVLGTIAVFASLGAGNTALDAGTVLESSYQKFGPISCGWEFVPAEDIVVTELGLYLPANWNGGSGFVEAHPIAIWEGAAEVISGTIPAGGGAVAGYVFVDTPDVTLEAGKTYVIAAYFASAADAWISTYTSGLSSDSLITVTQTGVYTYPSSGLEVPTTVSSYLSSPNFQFEIVTNEPPVADDEVAETTVETSVDIDVLDGDSDPDGDAIVVESVTSPANGTVVDNGDGTITYTPNAEFVGTDSFEYTISDGNGGTATALVTVTVKGPVEKIGDLVVLVEEIDLQQGIERSLDAKLDAALGALEDANENNDGSAVNKLQAFINEVEAQRGNKITDTQADDLHAAAQAIIDLLIGL